MLPSILFSLAIASVGLVVRFRSQDPTVRRRALLVVLLAATALLVRATLESLPPGETPYEILHVAFMCIGLLALLLLLVTVVVDLALVSRFSVEVPRIVRDTVLAGVFVLGVLIILYYETDLDVTGLFTTAGVISVVIGLALQNTLDNVFSGLALQSERPFGVGDWIEFDGREGVATDITWRSTKIRTRDNDLVIVPNSVVSKAVVVNYSAPGPLHAVTVSVGTDYRNPPAEVRAALEEVALQTDGVLRRPPVEVRTDSYDDFSITYQVRFWIRGYAAVPEVRNAFMTHIWYVFSRRGIEIPFPIRTVHMTEITEAGKAEEARREHLRRLEAIRALELFDDLPEGDVRDVAMHVQVNEYFPGETIIWEGGDSRCLYIVDRGRVEVILARNGRKERLAELGPGDFVGEMSLMTGEPPTATVMALEPTRCYVLEREGLRGTLERHPMLAERITDTLVRRRHELQATEQALQRQSEDDQQAEEHRQILSRIRDFFGF